jgi:hypothetical protein
MIEVPLIDAEVESDHPNCQLIEDYWYWFVFLGAGKTSG